jgi:hypothetical protein
MSTLAKREWNPRISLEEALSCSVGWLSKARDKNVLSSLPPTLYTAYIVDDAPYLGLMRDFSSLFRYSSKDDPELHRARDQALRLLSVALKAHFFIGRDSLARHEPYLFSVPDVSNPGSCHYGLVYRLEGRPNQTIMVATCDLGQISSLRPSAYKFPVVLTKNSYKWFDKKHWVELGKEADVFERVMKPWVAKQEHNVIEKWTDANDFPFGSFLDVPYELKDYVKPTGIKWADALKKWYLPRGFDIEPVREYIRWVEAEHKDNRDHFEALHWRLPPPKARSRSASAQPPAPTEPKSS